MLGLLFSMEVCASPFLPLFFLLPLLQGLNPQVFWSSWYVMFLLTLCFQEPVLGSPDRLLSMSGEAAVYSGRDLL